MTQSEYDISSSSGVNNMYSIDCEYNTLLCSTLEKTLIKKQIKSSATKQQRGEDVHNENGIRRIPENTC